VGRAVDARAGHRIASERASIPVVRHAVMLGPALGTQLSRSPRPSAAAGPTRGGRGNGIAGWTLASWIWGGIARLLGRGDQFARQARRHLQLPFGNEQFTMVVEGNPRRLGAVVAVKTGLDQAVKVPHGLDIDRQGDQF
jgi:hypothetical protein